MLSTLYVSRKLLNHKELTEWAKSAGFSSVIEGEDLHVTVAFSRNPVDWRDILPSSTGIQIAGGYREMELLNGGAKVLKFQSQLLQDRWKYFIDKGCTWDFPSYKCHVTISYDDSIDISHILPYNGTLVFGPEIFKQVDLDWKGKVKEK